MDEVDDAPVVSVHQRRKRVDVTFKHERDKRLVSGLPLDRDTSVLVR